MQDCSSAINMFNCPVPISLETQQDYCLKVAFNNGVTKIFDLNPYFVKYKFFAPLKEKKLFDSAKLERWAIVWNDDLDIAIEEVYEKGMTVSNLNQK